MLKVNSRQSHLKIYRVGRELVEEQEEVYHNQGSNKT